MKRLDWDNLPQPAAVLIQRELKDLGLYRGTTRGLPGPQTKAAYSRYLRSLGSKVSFGNALATVAEAQIGQRETGNNGGVAVRKYQGATWLEQGAWPWCAAFVCWCYREALKAAVDPGYKRPRTAGAWDFERWAREQGAELIKPASKAKRGDIIIFTFSHIGIVVKDQRGSVIHTVEGNTNGAGSRDGDGVYAKKRAGGLARSLVRF